MHLVGCTIGIHYDARTYEHEHTVQLYSALISYLEFNCHSMFEINKHKSNNYIFSIIPFEFGYKILISS